MVAEKRRLLWKILLPTSFVIFVILGALIGVNGFTKGLYVPVPVPPENGKQYTVLCLGDSLTHGNVSANYVAMLEEKLHGQSIRFVNGGMNGDMLHDLKARFNRIVAEIPDPDIVTILIGTNDANATLDKTVAQRALDHPLMGKVPDETYFRGALPDFVATVRTRTEAEVILISIPPIGEAVGSPEWNRSMQFAGAIRDAAEQQETLYVPFYEHLSELIESQDSSVERLPNHETWYRDMALGILLQRFRGWDYEEIGDHRGYGYHSDQLHLNESAANVLVDLLSPAIKEVLTDL